MASDFSLKTSEKKYWKIFGIGVLAVLACGVALWGVVYFLSEQDISLPDLIDWGADSIDTMILIIFLLSVLIVGVVLFTVAAVSSIMLVLGILVTLWVLVSIFLFPILFPILLPIALIILLVWLFSRRRKRRETI